VFTVQRVENNQLGYGGETVSLSANVTHVCVCCVFNSVSLGMTQSSIPSLVKKGIKGISVGVNDRTPPPVVPSLFVWQYANDSVMAAWHPGTN